MIILIVKNISLTVLVPFYNEENTIIKSLKNLIDSNVADEIILINDCSSDNSLKKLNKFILKDKNIQIINNDRNYGKGFCIKNAIKFINCEYFIVHDADLEYNPYDILDLKKLISKNPNSVILGSRFIGTKNRKNKYKRTIFANKFLSRFFSLFNLYTTTDVATCYKLFPSSHVKDIMLYEKGFSYEVEILSKMITKTDSIVEWPIEYFGRSFQEGKKIKFTDAFRYVISILKYRTKFI